METQLFIASRLAFLKDEELFKGLVQTRKRILGLIHYEKIRFVCPMKIENCLLSSLS